MSIARRAFTRIEPRAFTLIELLVVVSIIALLIAVLLPSLSNARRSGKASVCLSNCRQMSVALSAYVHENREYVIPSFNMTGIQGDTPLDGWGPILDRDRFIQSTPPQSRNSVFYCPETLDVAGVATGQTGNEPDNPKGWADWPFLRTGSANVPQTIPERRFNTIVRVAYWINADNPIGGPTAVTPDLFYTGSAGYGPGTNGRFIELTRVSVFARPAELIALADGLYAGRQRDAQIGMTNSRIGYRHSGKDGGSANVSFADGHASPVSGKSFPRALGGSNNPDDVKMENRQGRPTVYANPEKALGIR